MKPHRDISNWFITNIRKDGRWIYADLMIEYTKMVKNESKKYIDFLESGTLQSILKRIEKELN